MAVHNCTRSDSDTDACAIDGCREVIKALERSPRIVVNLSLSFVIMRLADFTASLSVLSDQ